MAFGQSKGEGATDLSWNYMPPGKLHYKYYTKSLVQSPYVVASYSL